MISLNNLIFVFLLALRNLDFSDGDCHIYPIDNKPTLWKYLGTQVIVYRDKITDLRLEENETINVQCARAIKISSNHGLRLNEKFSGSLEVKCSQNRVFVKKSQDEQWKHLVDQNANFGCERGQASIYESVKSLPHCKKYLSYGIGVRVSKDQQIVSLKMCFDLTNLQPKYIVYKPSDSNAAIDVNKITPVDDTSFSLDLDLIGFENIYKLANETDYDRAFLEYSTRNVFLRPFVFDYVSLLQDEVLSRDTQQYREMLSVVWWHNLRLGNWKIFIEAFEKQIHFQKYEVSMGVHGTLKFPTENSKEYDSFSVRINEQTIKTPEYIWAYVKPLNESSNEKEFVFVGYNSPFAKGSKKSNDVCKDICKEVLWLNTNLFKRTHKLHNFGLVNCCRPEDIGMIFDNFPFNKSQDVEALPNTTATSKVEMTVK